MATKFVNSIRSNSSSQIIMWNRVFAFTKTRCNCLPHICKIQVCEVSSTKTYNFQEYPLFKYPILVLPAGAETGAAAAA